MKRILVLGAGRSAASLIQYLLHNAVKENWLVRVGDVNLNLVTDRIGSDERSEGFVFDVNNVDQRSEEISQADIVVSMLPARFHLLVVQKISMDI